MADSQGQSGEDSQIDDAWVVCLRRIVTGDCDALGCLYDQSGPLVYSVARAILGAAEDAEEITLDVFAYVWRSAGNYDEHRGSVSTWLTMLTRSRALDRLRSRPASQNLEMEAIPAHLFLEKSAVDETAECDRRILVRRALQQLCPEQRQLLQLAFFSGFSHQELSSQLNIPLGTVKSRIRTALLHLRDLNKRICP
jgi:RNA polymerase sigma-70 factor (ECF subfamily)